MTSRAFPLVLFPRYSTVAGDGTFTTVGLDVSAFHKAMISVWRGQLVGTGTAIEFSIEESADQETWFLCQGASPFDPGQNLTLTPEVELSMRYLRVKVVLTGGDVVATFSAVGQLVSR